MGGNAFGDVQTTRMSLEIYNQILDSIIDKLSQYLNLYPNLNPPDKTDFGDIDIIYTKKDSNIVIQNILKDIFNPSYIKVNGRTTSWIYEMDNLYYQIDMNHCVDNNLLNMYRFYYSYGDLGGIIGRLTSYYGLKFGHNGLFLHVFNSTIKQYKSENNNTQDIDLEELKSDITYTKGDIILTQDPESICEYLDFDYNKYKSGFSSNIEIYDWIIKSKLFNPDIFIRLNNEHRKRYKVRPFYQKFREYILGTNAEVLNAIDSEVNNNLQLEAIKYFNKIDELDNIIEQDRIRTIRKTKFNGKMLLELGIDQKQLNKIIYLMKKSLYLTLQNDITQNDTSDKLIEHNWNQWLDSHTHEEIYNWIKTYIEKN